MRGEQRGVQAPGGDQPHQLGDAERVDEPRGDRDVADPQLLQVQGARPSRGRRCLATRPPGRISSAASRRYPARPPPRTPMSAPRPSVSSMTWRDRVLARVVDRGVRAEPPRASQARIGEVDRDNSSRGVQPRGQDRGQADRSGADDRDRIPGETMPLSTPTSREVGRMSARNSTCSSVSWAGILYTELSANGTRAYSACNPSVVDQFGALHTRS